MSAVAFVLLEIGIAVGVWRLADRARKQQLTARSAALFAGGCAVLLLMLIATDWPLTDWPTPEINAFWDEHGVLSGTVQSVLLFGVGLLSYEAGQLRAQERLDESVTAAGLGGIVDHVVDVEVGLAFLSSPQPPDAHGWVWSPGKPLQWLRQGRDRLSRSAPDRTGDPRTWPVTLPVPLTPTNGTCTVQLTKLSRTTAASVTFTVLSASRSGWTYVPAANHDPDGDSTTGTVIVIARP